MSNSPGIREVYEKRRAELTRQSEELGRRSGSLSAVRGITLLLTLGLVGYGIFRALPTAGWVFAALSGAVFVGLVVHHARVAARETHQEEQLALLAEALLRLDHRVAWDADGGSRFAEPHHAFAGDLDLFGARAIPRSKKQHEPPPPQAPVSLFQLVNTAQTGHGRKLVASWLGRHAPPSEVRRRQLAAQELAKEHEFRLELAGHGLYAKSTEVADDPLLAWAEETPAPIDPKLVLLSKVLVPLTVGLLIASQVYPSAPTWFARVWLAPLTVQMVLLIAMRQSVGSMIVRVTSRESPFGRFRALLAHIESGQWQSDALQEVTRRVQAGGGGEPRTAAASVELAKLERIISFADLRHNTLIHLLANLLLLWDVWCALALNRWRTRCGKQVRGWLDATGEMEALSSLATFAVEHPDFEWPEVSEGEAHFTAKQLGHPLIPADERVCNDVSLPGPGRALLVTGSNMSGKSTLLRAMGINAVLAQAGAPVCASGMRMSALSVWTSMRISDALERKISHFYAELERLKAILDAGGQGRPLLFLLDEILHGTNSRERHVGAKRVVLHLTDSGSVGAVSSHDVELAELEDESEGHVVNVHFAEQVKNDVMSFDYKLCPGVVKTRNALRLMKELGFPLQPRDVPTSTSHGASSDPPEFFGNAAESDN